MGTQTVLTQLSFRQMTGEILAVNPDIPPNLAQRFINNCYRRIIDRRDWKATFTEGVISSPGITSPGGTVSVTNGSNTVTGTGTNWTSVLVNQQFRISGNFPVRTITAVNSTTSLTLDLPWADQSIAATSYYIIQIYFDLGTGVKRLRTMVNQFTNWSMWVGTGYREMIDASDVWRVNIGFPSIAVPWPNASDGHFRVELWPGPVMVQSFPYFYYEQPSDMVADASFPVPWVRSDVVVYGAKSEAYLYGGPTSAYYSPTQAKFYSDLFRGEVMNMELRDNAVDLTDYSWNFTMAPIPFVMGMVPGLTDR